ncbi:hypothetical protein OF122_07380 [Pelagibacterium flavum]|uniref:Site-2 protease family protein n=1 Tax=Pelagibacterium flavum TaxID=2984530 RepID=A0ABY6ISL2_9HYPH|nr:hypothetical protein [Pelagibacterium sp. YIM 151497]MAN75802.1 hypothetical protein [Hyphomicrobiales bacterium]UYQ73568.1 hypothetical protein OF122_07380 [Pelagibacterium sp. YIM 151497]
MFDLSFLQILTRAIAAIIVMTFMGFCATGFARVLGDRGVVYDGKLTLNPFVHCDLFGLLAGIVGRVCWVRPIAIDPVENRMGRATPVVVALLTFAALFVFSRVVLLSLPLVAVHWPISSAALADATIRMTSSMAVWTLVINLVPVPPLLGGYLLLSLTPRTHKWLAKRHLYVSIALAALIVATHRSLSETPFGALVNFLGGP